ncbi:MAG: site-2 protease family protein [Planctomycetota bacterium]
MDGSRYIIGIATLTIAPAALIALHELAHAAAAWTLGMRVHQVTVGGRAAARVWWLGRTRISWTWYARHGFVMATLGAPRWFRSKHVLMAMAGPIVSISVAIALSVIAYHTPRQHLAGPATYAGALTAIYIAAIATWPRRLDLEGGGTDTLLAWNSARLSQEQVAEAVQSEKDFRIHSEAEDLFLRGEQDAAETTVDAALRDDPDNTHMLYLRALLHAARGDAHAACATQALGHSALEKQFREAEARIHDQTGRPSAAESATLESAVSEPVASEPVVSNSTTAEPGPTEHQSLDRRQQQEQRRALRYSLRACRRANVVNRAFFQLLTGAPNDLHAASERLEPLLKRLGKSDQLDACSIARTVAFARLLEGRASEAEALLRAAIHTEEPYWLTALSMHVLGHALRMQMRPRDAKSWFGRARRLHRSNLLYAAIDRRLATTSS